MAKAITNPTPSTAARRRECLWNMGLPVFGGERSRPIREARDRAPLVLGRARATDKRPVACLTTRVDACGRALPAQARATSQARAFTDPVDFSAPRSSYGGRSPRRRPP